MSKKLLDRTLRFYILLSVVVLIVSAPLFYLFTEKLFIEDADEALLLRKREFLQYNLKSINEADIAKWNAFNRDIKIEKPDPAVKRDSILYKFFIDTLANNENEPYRVLLSPFELNEKPYLLMARINLVESEDMIKGIAFLFCLILSVLLIGLYVITRKLSKKLWNPFYITLQQIENFELDKSVTLEFEPSQTEEFNRLNQSVGKLLERNATVYKKQKEFIENAAHELQTPLATFQVKLDSLAQQLPFTQELSDTLSNLNDAVSRLTRINKNLLLLSRIENDQFAGTEQVAVSETLRKQSAFLVQQAEGRGVEVIVKHIDALTINANPTLLEIAISNLLLNALRHNIEGGRILITLTQNILVISNSGQNTALDSTKLFERFSHHRAEGGNGLGLAISRKIAELHRWTLEYAYRDNLHVFSVTF